MRLFPSVSVCKKVNPNRDPCLATWKGIVRTRSRASEVTSTLTCINFFNQLENARRPPSYSQEVVVFFCQGVHYVT